MVNDMQEDEEKGQLCEKNEEREKTDDTAYMIEEKNENMESEGDADK